jgi:hypothetical protein
MGLIRHRAQDDQEAYASQAQGDVNAGRNPHFFGGMAFGG